MGCVKWAALLLAPALFGQTQAIDLDAKATQINWTLNGNVHTVHGTFQLKEGHASFDPSTGSVSGEIVVDAASGESGNHTRDGRMAKDVLETAQYPTITLKLSKVEGPLPIANGAAVQVSGQFTIHGATHEITVPVQVTMSKGEVSGKGKFVVPYVDWGMKDPSNFLFKVNKTVEIEILAVGRLK